MGLWGIVGLWIVGWLIVALRFGSGGGEQWFTTWRGGAKVASPACPATGPRALKPRTPEDRPACRACRACRGQLSDAGTDKAAVGVSRVAVTNPKTTNGLLASIPPL